MAVRLGSAGLQLVVAGGIVAAVGADGGGQFFANLAAIELAALTARLGLPTVLARHAALSNQTELANQAALSNQTELANQAALSGHAALSDRAGAGPPLTVLAVAPIAAVVGAGLAAAFERPVLLVALGAAAVGVSQCSGGWLRGLRRPALGALLHPTPGLLGALLVITPATLGLAGTDGPALTPTTAYVVGAMVACATAMLVVVGWRRVRSAMGAAEYRSAVLLGGTELVNQAVLLAPTLILVRFASAEAALVFGLAVRLIRPLAIARFAVIQTFGPAFAGDRSEALAGEQRRLASTLSGLMTGAGVAYGLVALPLVLLFGQALVGESGSATAVGPGDAASTQSLAGQLTVAWSVLAAGAVINLSTGPTGQLLAMRDLAGLSLRASLLALAVAPVALVGGWGPAVTAAVAVALAETTQALATGLMVRRRLGWASPVLGGSPR